MRKGQNRTTAASKSVLYPYFTVYKLISHKVKIKSSYFTQEPVGDNTYFSVSLVLNPHILTY